MNTETIILIINFLWDFFGENLAETMALCALGLTIWQGILTRTHNRMSVVPSLNFEILCSKIEPQLLIHLYNRGLGPAKVQSCSVLLDGKELDLLSVQGALEEVRNGLDLGIAVGGGILRKGDIIAPGVHRELFRFITARGIDEKINHEKNQKTLRRLQIIVKYESLYGLKLEHKLNHS
jgi:hypothetical protein